ncbi:MAG: sodium:calcium antiporter, partial [Caldilinea sp.]
VAQQLVRFDVPLMIGVSVLVWVLSLNGFVERWEGAVLFAGILLYTVFLIVQSRREQNKTSASEFEAEYTLHEPVSWQRTMLNVGLAVGGLALLVLGARWFIDGAVGLARILGLSELIIGLTIVAAGTSMPEVATSVVAALRGERDIAVGNVVGSNIFNILAVLGVTAIVTPGNGVPVADNMLVVDMPFMIAVAIACLPIFFTGHTIARWEGVLFLGYYAAYTIYLFLDAVNQPAIVQYREFMLLFVAPLTLITLLVSVGREIRRRRASAKADAVSLSGK